jgi:hypothetical protein
VSWTFHDEPPAAFFRVVPAGPERIEFGRAMVTQADTVPGPACPTCGARITRPELSLCAYCGSPLALGVKPRASEDETTRRLQRLRETPEFQAALGLEPVPPEAGQRANRMRAVGWVLVAAWGLWLVVQLARGELLEGWVLTFAAWAGLLIGATLLMSARTLVRRERGPLFKRGALVVDRRSETSLGEGRTTYFFTLRLDDGSEGVFRLPGRGGQYDLMAAGTVGIAYTRGAELIEFLRLRG